MALSGKYGKISIPKICEDEPIFILRAQDILAAATVEIYRVLLESHGSPMVKNIDQEVQIFKHWPGSKKMPD
ncbi:MAG: hypothetical protein A2Y97_04205 [Nitrospirae bacterium RBG_13_39_12]|nr:MAG: hypothetical protein A2Y97_04205 [Nitrospirae bacterium RBG_13_39_12]